MPETKQKKEIEVHFSYEAELARISNLFESKITNFLKDYSFSEILTFETKRVEAEKYIATEESKYIVTLAGYRNEDPLELAKRIDAKAAIYLDAYAQLEAWKYNQVKELKVKFNII